MNSTLEPSSFRDPSGFVYYRDGEVYRQVQTGYRDNWDLLISSGLYAHLTAAGLLIPHKEEPVTFAASSGAYVVLRPETIPFISYPYEWCFSQLKAAALATLDIQRRSIEHGMSLKDASAYNIQFRNANPVLIDTLSFERYTEGAPWIGYRQFCQHFLAPLALMSLQDIRLGQLLRNYIDGIPLDLASRLLPRSTWLKPGLLMHIHQHSAAQKRGSDIPSVPHGSRGGVSKMGMLGIIDSLRGTITGLTWRPEGTTWANYYAQTNYTEEAMEGKRRIVASMIESVLPQPQPFMAWDLGANCGVFSRIASSRGIHTVSWDFDPASVEKNYQQCVLSGEENLLPLVADLTNPSPDLGWALKERSSILSRGPAGITLALALVHHLAIANNVPLEGIAKFLSSVSNWLLVEFVPKSDSQVQRLLAGREDVFPDYTRSKFEAAFQKQFRLIQTAQVPQSERTIYLMQSCRHEDG